MSLSLRAFEEAQRRRLYPQRNGATGVACIQRDLLLACKEIASASEHLWIREKTDIEEQFPWSGHQTTNQGLRNSFNVHLTGAAVYLMRVSGSLGFDLFIAAKQEIERQELSII
jgi:hypothetical protein